MPSRFSPVVTASDSAMSASTACGRMPRTAIGMAARMATHTPQAMDGMPNCPQMLVTAKARQKKKNAKATSFFLPIRLASMFTGA